MARRCARLEYRPTPAPVRRKNAALASPPPRGEPASHESGDDSGPMTGSREKKVPPMAVDPRSFFPASRFGVVRSVCPLGPGLSGAAVYAVATSRGEFVLRLQGDDREAWLHAVAMQRLAADRGIAPALEYVDEERGGVVCVKIEGMTLPAALAQPSIRLTVMAEIAERVAALHAIPLPAGVESPNASMADSLWQSQVDRPGFPVWAIGLGSRLAEAIALQAGDPRVVLCHGDFHPMNMIWDGTRVWVVDWERAGPGHPYVDLATFSNFMSMTDEVALGLLSAQERTPVAAREKELFLAVRDRCRIVYGAVFLRLIPDLEQVGFAAREDTPSLTQCFQSMAAGELTVESDEGKAKIGAAFFRQVG
jgi:aminoglycoside phosphotransferase (APT) family kinase protein